MDSACGGDVGAAGRIALPDANARPAQSVAVSLHGQCLIISEKWYNRLRSLAWCLQVPCKGVASGLRKNLIARTCGGVDSWPRVYVSPVGRGEVVTCNYIMNRKKEDLRLEQLEMFGRDQPPSGGSQPKRTH